MPLIPCPDCGREVSDAAPACPQCGRPAKKKTQPIIRKPLPPRTAEVPMETSPGQVMYFRRMGLGKPSRPNPWMAVFFGILITGAGHALQGRWGKAVAYFLSVATLAVLGAVLSPAFWFLQALVWIFSIIDAGTWNPNEE